MSDVTRLLVAIDRGDPKAGDELLPLVYDELRKLAAIRMANEASGQTLQPTALVHEAWLRLVASEQQTWQNRAHFFAAAAEAMRRILIDRARQKGALKRGAGQKPLDLEQVDVAVEMEAESLIQINSVLDRLALVDSQASELVKLRFFVGLNYEEASKVLGISERSAKRCWTFARAWMYRELTKSSNG